VRKAALTLAVAAAYFAAAKVGLSMAFDADHVTLVWPPSGIALACLLRFGFGAWHGVALGAFLANATANEPLPTALGIAIGNTLEGLFGAWLLRRAGFDPRMEKLNDVLGLVAVAVVLSPIVAATLGVASLCLGGVEPWSRATLLWRVWWMGDAIGILIVAPPLLVWTHWSSRRIWPRRVFEAVALAFGLGVICLMVFAGWRSPVEEEPLAYLVFPFIIWTAFRFQQLGSTLAVFLVSVVAIWGTLHGFGPFASPLENEGLFLLQTFLGVVALTGLTLASATAERNAALNQVREGHSVLRAITEGTTDAIFVKDLDGRYLMINPAGARLLGKSVEEVVGKDDRDLFAAESAARIMARDRSIMIDGNTSTHEETGTAAGVTRTYLSTKGPYRDEEGRIIGLIGISRDITERMQADEERRDLLEREKELRAAADEASRRKDEFLSLLSHELRNPLAPIRNGLEILQQDASEKTLKTVLELMGRQLHHLTRLVDDLLDVSRITSGRIELRPEPTDLRRILERAVEASRPVLDSREHALSLSLPEEPLPVLADVTRLDQVFVNLLNNAAKYTDPRGSIELEAEREADSAVVRLRDNGRGMAPEFLPRIFDLFTQADRSLARSEGGLGVGLTLVRRLVEMHRGSVRASSPGEGRGSEFVVRLPLAAVADRNEGARPRRKAAKHATLRVLVVEDQADSARSLSLLLELLGHEVEVVADGRNAIEAVERFRPTVVLLDIGLPGMDGYEVARRLRARGSKALLVSLTGYGRDADKLRSREAGFDDHLVKPVELETLERLLTSMALRV
jgi:PAS domain S-box-containing protein